MIEMGDLLAEDEVLEERRPAETALSEFWLSATGTPWFVVSTRPPESTRTRSSGPLAGLTAGPPTVERALDSDDDSPGRPGFFLWLDLSLLAMAISSIFR